MQDEQDLEPMLKHIAKTGLIYETMVYLGIGGVVAGLVGFTSGDGGWVVFSMLASIVGATLLLYSLKRFLQHKNPRLHPVYAALLHRSREIVWIYEREFRMVINGIRGKPECFLVVGLRDGDLLELGGFREGQAAGLFGALKARIPHAAFGYSEELAKRFEEAPWTLSNVMTPTSVMDSSIAGIGPTLGMDASTGSGQSRWRDHRSG